MKTPKPTVFFEENNDQKSGIDRRDFLYKGGALALGLGLFSRLSVFADENKPVPPLVLPNVDMLGWRLSV